MPSRNIKKVYSPDSYYHVYARGINKQPLFLDPNDFKYFTNLFERYLSNNIKKDTSGAVYPNYSISLNLLAYCLMKNHFHLLLFQHDIDGMSKLMKSIMTSYSRYYNLKYKRSGPLYESTYKASRITSDQYLIHISRYIHLNARYWKTYSASSISYYLRGNPPLWLHIDTIASLFDSSEEYKLFLEDYEDQKAMFEEIKHELADQ